MTDSQKYRLIVNGQVHEVSISEISDDQIRALAGIPRDNTLVIEMPGNQEDRIIMAGQTISLLEKPVQIYSAPPTTFG